LKSRQYNTGRFPPPAICTRAAAMAVLMIAIVSLLSQFLVQRLAADEG
jgi:hypothetical protein